MHALMYVCMYVIYVRVIIMSYIYIFNFFIIIIFYLYLICSSCFI